MRKPDTDWRKLLMNFAKCFLKTPSGNISKRRVSFFIAEDSDLEKSTGFFERISRVFNQVAKTYPFVYKVFTLGYSDGKSFIPLDFSLHNEKGKKENFGLTTKERKGQHSKKKKQVEQWG